MISVTKLTDFEDRAMLQINPPSCLCASERKISKMVRYRAAKMGFRGADLDDAQQEVLLKLMAFRYREEFTCESAAVAALINFINLYLLTAKRGQQRYQRSLGHVKKSIASGYYRVAESDETNNVEDTHRAQDVQDVLARLSSEDRELCHALVVGESIHAIADRLGCGWHTVKRRIDRLREYFTEMGMDGYVQ
jgi:RNA polymerase sigma factor (sigma-70 family)